MNTTDIHWMGQKVVLRTTGEDPVIAKEVLDLCAEVLATAEGRAKKNQAPHQVALLALLDLSERHVRARRAVGAYQEKIGTRSKELLDLLSADADVTQP